jgi:hypothetical protein
MNISPKTTYWKARQETYNGVNPNGNFGSAPYGSRVPLRIPSRVTIPLDLFPALAETQTQTAQA